MKNGFKALIVDDQPVVRSVVSQMLAALGCFDVVEEAADGREAWDLLGKRPFDVVVSDVEMPRMNGLELLRRCMRSGLKDAAFLMITGNLTESVLHDCLASGARAVLGKPFSFTLFKETIEDILSSGANGAHQVVFREVRVAAAGA